MKILPFDPKGISAAGSLDDSRLGFHAQPVNPESLRGVEHGIVLLGIADDTGVRNVGGRPGAKDGPAAARQKLYKFTTGAPAAPFYDLGELLPEETIEATHASAATLVKKIAALGHFPLVIGGGHDLGFPHALGVLEAGAGARFRFLNVDAHLDLRPVTNGITSGSPWYLLREHPLYQSTRSRIEEFGIQPHCNAHVLVDYARKHGLGLHWLDELRENKKGVPGLFSRLLGPRSGRERLLVSLDIDSVHFPDAPGCSAPQTLGFTAAEAIAMSHHAGSHPRVDSFGIFELSPPLDPDGRTALLVAHCISACMEGFATRQKVKRKKR